MTVYRHLALSGGRSSAYMLWRMVEQHGGLPQRMRVVFANTGRERDQTLDFVDRLGRELGVAVDWLEYRDMGRDARPRHHYAVVDHATASRQGEPFEQMIRACRRLPSPLARRCTAELKVRTMERYLSREHGWPKPGPQHKAVLGIRWDEPGRWRKALYEECTVEYPMVEWKTTRADVLAFWRSAPFDLALPEGTEWSNCDLCFFKKPSHLRSLAQREPQRLKWWLDLEREARTWGAQRLLRKPEMAGWNPRLSYEELAGTGQLPMDLDEAGQIPCFCTD